MKNSCKILVPVSLTEPSYIGVKYANHIAAFNNCEVDIFHVLQESVEDKVIVDKLDIVRKELGTDVNYKEIISRGEPAVEIMKIVSELEPGLVVMSPDIIRKEKKFYDESVAGRQIKESNYPVLIVPPNIEFKEIRNIILGTTLSENTIQSIKGILKIFQNGNPHIKILVLADDNNSWHFNQEVSELIQRLKDYTEYLNLSGNICDHSDIVAGLEVFAERVHADLICMEYNTEIFNKLFFNVKNSSSFSRLLNKPILVLPRYWEDAV